MSSPSKIEHTPKNTVFIVAGEESGDIHGSHLVKEMLKINPQLSFIGHGGNRMNDAGVKIIEHISNLALVGLTEVIKHLPHMRKVMINTIALIKSINPSRIILIDYPGFNLQLAKKLDGLEIPITYFILPQVWAWNENRVNILKKYIDQAISIIPFEKEWYKNKQMDIEYVGNPLVEMKRPLISKTKFFAKHSLEIDWPLLALLPGSRQQEIDRHWSVFLKAINALHKTFPDLQFIVGKAPNVELTNIPRFVKIESDNSHLTLLHGTAGIVASGTASLEATVYNLPIVVCYKTSRITHFIGKRLAKVKFLSMTNLIAKEKIIPELIQNEMNSKNIVKTIVPLLSNTPEKDKMLKKFKMVNSRLGEPGVYSRAAKNIMLKI